MERKSAAAVALILLGIVAVSQALNVDKLGSRELRHVNRRSKRTVDKQFVCVLPINETANEPYIHCGILNETQSEYSMPVDISDRYKPRFEYALLCSNFTLVEDEESAEEDSSASTTEEDSDEEDGDLSEEDLCLRVPYDDCSVQCVYRETDVLNEQGLPEADNLYEHVLQLVNRDEHFKRPVKDAVKSCHKQMVDTIHKYGVERLNMCLLMEIVDECLEYEIGMRCPKRVRLPFKKS